MILIDPSTRQFNIPGADLTFGVESDAGAARKHFRCPRYVGDNVDLASCFIRMNYRNANGEMDCYLVEDVAIEGDNVTFSWLLTQKVTMYKGQVKFVVCAVGPDQKVEWHTTLGSGMVLEGLEPTHNVVADTTDVVAQLIAMVNQQTRAVESTGETWVAAVETEGAAQVVAVQTAAEAAQSLAVAQIEAKGVATLATIPEDYTVISNATNEQANTIKGNLTGAVVRADDVSPLGHTMKVVVKSKNLIPPFPETKSSVRDGVTFSIEENGQTIMLNGTCGTIGGGRNNFANITRRIPLKKGKTYTLSHWVVSGSSDGVYSVYLTNAVDNVAYSSISSDIPSRRVVVEEDVECFIGVNAALGKSYDNLVVKFQLEEGTTATDYTPYVEPTTVTVKRCGRNLIPQPYTDQSGTRTGITFTVAQDGAITASGTSTGASFAVARNTEQKIFLHKDKTYYFRCVDSSGNMNSYYSYINSSDGMKFDTGDGVVITPTVSELVSCLIVIRTGITVDNIVFRPMLTLVEGDSSFETYTGEDYTPGADGTVGGVTSLSPTMVLTTNSAGTFLECEYNRDTNKVIADLYEKIAALSGN